MYYSFAVDIKTISKLMFLFVLVAISILSIDAFLVL
jgi:hypothetical protein